MATTLSQTQRRSGFDSWKDGIDKADEKWNAYDGEIKSAVLDYELHLGSTTPGFPGLDWRIVKAMLWVETGAKDVEWKVRPMRIGVRHDPGLPALLGKIEGGWLIIPPSYQLNVAAVSNVPRDNIRAGIGYLLMKMANFDIRTVTEPDSQIYDVTVAAGDSLDRIARAHGSTIDVMLKLNPTAAILHPGQVLKLQKASKKKVVVSWKRIDLSSVAQYYNAGGDSRYKQKLQHAWDAIRKESAR